MLALKEPQGMRTLGTEVGGELRVCLQLGLAGPWPGGCVSWNGLRL